MLLRPLSDASSLKVRLEMALEIPSELLADGWLVYLIRGVVFGSQSARPFILLTEFHQPTASSQNPLLLAEWDECLPIFFLSVSECRWNSDSH